MKAYFLYKIEKTFVLNLDLSTNTLFRFHFADEHGLQQKYDTDVYIIHTDEKSIVYFSWNITEVYQSKITYLYFPLSILHYDPRLYSLIILNKLLITQLLINNTAQQKYQKITSHIYNVNVYEHIKLEKSYYPYL